ncbi:vesicle-trafficking protein SEC22b [Pyxicephalus adspersus]|uniref:vesicle-trafficking protein SEC22b n=1 Tax=Pyxicephalus adspersus TaxID=30357 RepID=UPI003B593236
MVLLTMIARVADGLPLAASMQEDEQSGRDLQQYQNQAKQLFRKLNEQSPARCTLEAGAMTFHYLIEKGVCYLVLCEMSFPKKLAFAYLEDLYNEFDEQHGKKVPTVSRPYSFIEFGELKKLHNKIIRCRDMFQADKCVNVDRQIKQHSPIINSRCIFLVQGFQVTESSECDI